MKNIILILILASFLACNSNSNDHKDKAAILKIMEDQAQAWSDYDIEGFMKGYWASDSLKFYGASGITYGYEQTLANYHKRYPSKEHTGHLDFKINDISKINDTAYFVMGEYHLVRQVGNADGIFMIIFKKMNGTWKIIADTSC